MIHFEKYVPKVAYGTVLNQEMNSLKTYLIIHIYNTLKSDSRLASLKQIGFFSTVKVLIFLPDFTMKS
jgi:hypothetical protein